MTELLLELFSEEIPARMQARAAEDLQYLVVAGLKDAGLEHGEARTYVTPRRLTLVIDGLPDKQPNLREEKRGPRIDAPDRAIEGFLSSSGLTREQCEERELPKGKFLFAVVKKTGAETKDVLPGLLEKVVEDLPWPKSMRWGDGDMRWVRSLERVLCLFGSDVLPLRLRNDIPCGKTTSGHRFLAPKSFDVDGFEDYANKLKQAFVVLDREERKAHIAEHAAAAAKEEALTLRDDPGLLDEVTGLVEWPVVMTGKIDHAFMDVPEEVLITSMRAHQKYFSLLNDDGRLAPRFVVVANTETKDNGASIVAGNERVLRARLSDAKFFWDQDRKKKLEDGLPKLADSIFHAKLGTMAEKVERITALAGELSPHIPKCDADQAMRAAYLAKADLVTEMVYEFPELQGTMGRYYSLKDGEDDAVANAIADHYSPAGPNDNCPAEPASVAVALADKLDTLVGFFSVDEKPTGSRDPYALRRAALGIIRLVLENGLRLPLRDALMKAYRGYNETAPYLDNTREGGHKPKTVEIELLDFFADRLKVYLRERGVRHDYVEAVFALGNEDDFVRLIARVDALSGFLASDDGKNLVAAFKRASNIVAIEEKRDGTSFDGKIAADKITQAAERELVDGLSTSGARALAAIDAENYVEAMEAMSTLRRPVDLFFDKVTVNTDDPDVRANRLQMLSQFRSTLGQIADFSRIES